MHKIRKQARREAWYSDGSQTNLNPFARHGIRLTTSHSEAEDLESGLTRGPLPRATSESHYRTDLESRRQSVFGLPDRALSDQDPAVSSGARIPRSSTGQQREPLPPLSSSSHSPQSPNFERPSEKENFPPQEASRDISESNETGTSNATDSQFFQSSKEISPQLDQVQTNVQDVQSDGARKRNKRSLGGILGKFRHKDSEGSGNGDAGNGQQEDLDDDAENKKKKKHHNFTVWSQFQHTLFNSPINILLIAAPVGIALNFAIDSPGAVFGINFIAIIPLAALLSYATEEIALRVGETFGGLLNATFGNATELIVSIIALFKGEIIITQTSLVGSMLSNLLLVMGMCFFFGGLSRVRQHFNITVAQTAASLLALSLAGLIVPTVFDVQTKNIISNDITTISRGVSVILLLVYGCYLFFQLHTHIDIYNMPSQKEPKRNLGKGEANKGIASIGQMFGGSMAPEGVRDNMMNRAEHEDEEEEPKLHLWVAIFTLAACTALIAVCSEFMVDKIEPLTEQGGISKSFVGLILLPIVGNAAEHATAVTVAIKDKMDLAIGVAVGSSMQIALLVFPLVVIIGWIAGIEGMNLDLDVFQIVILFISVLLVNYLIADGESHWLEGAQLMILYVIIALAAWYYPQPCTAASEFCPQTGAN